MLCKKSDLKTNIGRKKPRKADKCDRHAAKKQQQRNIVQAYVLENLCKHVLLIIGIVIGLLPRLHRKVYRQFLVDLLGNISVTGWWDVVWLWVGGGA